MNERIKQMALAVAAAGLIFAGCTQRAGTGGSGMEGQDTTDDLSSGATSSGSPTDVPEGYDRPSAMSPGTAGTGGAGGSGAAGTGGSGEGTSGSDAAGSSSGGEFPEDSSSEQGSETPDEGY